MTQDARMRALESALLRRTGEWRAAVERAGRLASGRVGEVAEATRLVEDYRLLAHDLATARRLMPDSRAREYLESAYAQTHATLHRPASHPLYALWSLFRDQLPAVAGALLPHVLWVTALFVAAIFSGWWLVRTYPELIGLFASPQLIASVERGVLWTEGLLNVVPSSVLSLQILTNNVMVSLFAYCAGFLFGLGTFYIVGLNGLMLGAIFAFTGQHGLAGGLFEFIVAHGCVELSVLCLSGAAGASVGEALVRPDAPTRGQAFQRAALQSGRLLLACVLLLIGAGFIEGYVSADPEFPLWTRVVIGVGYFLLMIALLRGWLFGRSRSPQPVPL